MTKSETVAEMPDLETVLGQLHDAVARHKRGRKDAIQAAIDGGLALAALRDRAQHGDWGRWVRQAGLTERTAHNWRRLAGLGMTAEQVVAEGGLRKTLAKHKVKPEPECGHSPALESPLLYCCQCKYLRLPFVEGVEPPTLGECQPRSRMLLRLLLALGLYVEHERWLKRERYHQFMHIGHFLRCAACGAVMTQAELRTRRALGGLPY